MDSCPGCAFEKKEKHIPSGMLQSLWKHTWPVIQAVSQVCQKPNSSKITPGWIWTVPAKGCAMACVAIEQLGHNRVSGVAPTDSDLAYKSETFLIHMMVRGQGDLFRAKPQG